jgi:hypothetical protein
MTTSEIESATFQLVAQCLKQICYQQRAPVVVVVGTIVGGIGRVKENNECILTITRKKGIKNNT